MKKFLGLFILPLLVTSCGSSKSEFNFSFDDSKGNVTSTLISGTYDKGTEITLEAKGEFIYSFLGFYDTKTNELVSKETPYTFKLDKDISLEAKFSPFFEDEELVGTIIPGENGVLPTVYQVPKVEEYYKDFDFSLTKEDLRKEIRTKTKVKNYFSYKETSHALRYIDESLKTPGKLYGIYDGKAWDNTWQSGSTWNKEHVWPQSKFRALPNAATVKGDIHNLRICTNPVNSFRANKDFDEKEKESSAIYYPNASSDISDDFRGDVARIIFYMYGQYYALSISDTPTSNDNSCGILSTLLKWNKDDPVDQFERQRNMKISMYQGNRNIFIDYPELVYKLF